MKIFIWLSVFMSLMLSIVFLPEQCAAQNCYAGARYSYLFWDSAVSQMFDDLLDDIMKNRLPEISTVFENLEYDIDSNQGKGYMAGPVLGYVTDDRKWVFDLELLFLNSFGQTNDVTAWYRGLEQTKQTVPVDVKMERRDYKADARYNFNKYFYASAGYKYEIYNVKSDIKVPYITLPDDLVKYEYETVLHVFLPGAGASIPFGEDEKYRCGINMSIPLGIPLIEDRVRDEEIEVNGKYAFIGEIYTEARFAERFVFRLGYAAERYKAEVRMKERDIRDVVTETSHGVNITVLAYLL